MNEKLKKRWIVALESGEYKKGQERLCLKNQYCCLGVLAKIQGCRAVARLTSEDELLTEDNAIKYAAGLSRRQQLQLAEINDDTETFDEVINYIKKNL